MARATHSVFSVADREQDVLDLFLQLRIGIDKMHQCPEIGVLGHAQPARAECIGRDRRGFSGGERGDAVARDHQALARDFVDAAPLVSPVRVLMTTGSWHGRRSSSRTRV